MSACARSVEIHLEESPLDVDSIVDAHIDQALASLDASAPQLFGMAKYHLGSLDQSFSPVMADSVDKGKRIRPLLAMLVCRAAGGSAADAGPIAAAIELLHNFTLVHDDIQDHSPMRRHRPTVWSVWGPAQAINTGDALFAAAHLAMYQLRDGGIPANTVLELAAAFDRMTIEIVSGQVLDLDFENRESIAAVEYLKMIEGKTAAIVRFAAWSGAVIASAESIAAQRFADFGLALGLGFQVQDDLLGVWGETLETGKVNADDIRRKKKSLPILLLREQANGTDLKLLDKIFSASEIDSEDTLRVLELLSAYQVREFVEARVQAYHVAAHSALDLASTGVSTEHKEPLTRLIDRLATRTH